MTKNIAFILDHKLHHYRVPLFFYLAESYNIEIFHRGPKIEDKPLFQQHIINYKKIGPFELITDLPSLADFDVIVIMQNLRILNLYTLPLILKHKPLLMWGIGTSSSKGLDSELKLSVFLRNLVTLAYRGLALYSSIPINKYWQGNKAKIRVIGNSIFNETAFDSSDEKKEYFLFIGSLTKRKGIHELINAFNHSISIHPKLRLKIVGDGPQRKEIQRQIIKLGLANNVDMLGSIHDSIAKKKIFSKAHCVISPLQAGLSVVDSFSYGVPFVTTNSAITGGESQSIIHDINGVVFENINDLSDIICSFVDGRRSSSLLGSHAYQVYVEELDFSLYVNRFKSFLDEHLNI